MTNCPRNGRVSGHVTVLNFGQISVNISKTVHDRGILSTEVYRKPYMAYRMAPVLVTLNDLLVIPRLQAFSSAICRTFVQYFTRFQLTALSLGPSATAGLLVS